MSVVRIAMNLHSVQHGSIDPVKGFSEHTKTLHEFQGTVAADNQRISSASYGCAIDAAGVMWHQTIIVTEPVPTLVEVIYKDGP